MTRLTRAWKRYLARRAEQRRQQAEHTAWLTITRNPLHIKDIAS